MSVGQTYLFDSNFHLFSPDENNSNRWQDVLDVSNRAWNAEILPDDDHLAPDAAPGAGKQTGDTAADF